MNSFLKKFIIGEWNIGICNRDFIQEFRKVEKGGTLTLPVIWMKHNRPMSFFADPFIYDADAEKAVVLAEEFVFPRNKGVISRCTIDRKTGRLTDRKVILEESCHLSYPFYDPDTGRFAPESCRNGNWASYSFDGDMVSDKRVIFNRPLIDCTPVKWGDCWYLFAVEQPHALDRLLIYSADSRYGEYRPHPKNPAKDDIRTSRCGGKCFIVDGELYRAVQDSTHLYGECMHITHVTELTPTTFAEEDWCDINIEHDGRFSLGMHTLNFKRDFIVIDGYRNRFRPFSTIYFYKIVPILRKLHLHK